MGGKEMQIKLENIGIIKNSTIVLDGLTIVTGKNNSGKTTVGKTLYALLDAVCNLRQKAMIDKKYYIRKQLEEVQDTLDIFRYIRIRRLYRESSFMPDYPAISIFVFGDHRRDMFQENIEKYAHDLANELETFNASVFEKSEKDYRELLYYRTLVRDKYDSKSISIADMFDKQRNSALVILGHLFEALNKDVELIDYARESINQALQTEFSGQIQPVKKAVLSSSIELFGADSTFFKLAIVDNNVVNDGTPVFLSAPYKNVYLIDDPLVLDDISNMRAYRSFELHETETILNPNRIYPHNFKLKLALKANKTLSVFEKTVLDESLKQVKKQIDQIVPGTFEMSSEGEYYVQDGVKLKISNLAAGSKMFSIVKMLLDKGKIDSGTMLIFDEPEAHLHPKWQNTFAETIVLLVKELNVNVLLTTHSPNFMLAVDAYMRKYKIAEKTNFYQTDVLEDGFVQYHCVNDDMGLIYQDFLQYLSEVKMLRNKYLVDIEE